jgi:imidazoleglycerol phosphate synthase cyclase subunit
LDVKDGETVKGTNFVNLRSAGDPVELGKAYSEQGADELCFLDITASFEGRKTFTEMVTRVAKEINIPFTVGGGINELADVERLLYAGADKVSVNSAAIRRPELINYYCSNMCAIGRQYMPEVKTTGLSQIVLHILASMNALEKEKDRLVEITVDGTISGDELKDFVRIRNMVNQISMAADAMNLWIEQSIAAGNVSREELDAVSEELKRK